MSRPRKNTIDYFPHPVKDGSRMYIMEQKYGDKGYCCYYKLLQQLGCSENHFLDFTGIKDRLYFAALIRSSEEEVSEMLTTLAEIGTIDKDLWEEKKIWCQELVDSISEVYVKRRRELPKKPSFRTENPPTTGVSGSQNPQSKVKESKVKESSYIISVSNQKFYKKISLVLLEDYTNLFETCMMTNYPGKPKELILNAMDKLYPIYDFNDQNHLLKALQKAGTGEAILPTKKSKEIK